MERSCRLDQARDWNWKLGNQERIFVLPGRMRATVQKWSFIVSVIPQWDGCGSLLLFLKKKALNKRLSEAFAVVGEMSFSTPRTSN